jgi:hypothetical protein
MKFVKISFLLVFDEIYDEKREESPNALIVCPAAIDRGSNRWFGMYSGSID